MDEGGDDAGSGRSSEDEVKAEDVELGEETGEDVVPLEGTPAADALRANAGIRVSRFDKTLGRRIKRPKPKNLTRNMKTRKGRRRRSYIKGKIIDGRHEQYTLALGMMHALRVAIGRRVGPTARQSLHVTDFMSVDKYVFPPDGMSRGPLPTPPHHLAHTFKFKDYSPMVFRDIRALSNLDDSNYMLSVCGNRSFIEFIPNSKSGQFFFYSHDGKYMIKTQTPEENRFLRRILPYYYRHLRENPDSLMTRFYGMHRVKMYHLRRKVHFVIMGSVFNTTERIHTIYDLKGSRKGRSATADERKNGGVLKDNDLVNDDRKIVLGPKKARFLDILRRDVAFLKEMRIMDYSLLLGIHDKGAPETAPEGSPRKRSDTPLTRARIELQSDDRNTFILEGSPLGSPRLPEDDESEHASLDTVQEEQFAGSNPSLQRSGSSSSSSGSERHRFAGFLARRKIKGGSRASRSRSPPPSEPPVNGVADAFTEDGPAVGADVLPEGRSHMKFASEDSIDSPAYGTTPHFLSDEDFSESEVEDVETDDEYRRRTPRGAGSEAERMANGATPRRQRGGSRGTGQRAGTGPADAAGESKTDGNGTAAGPGHVNPDRSRESEGTLGATPSLAAIYPEAPVVLTRRKDRGVRSRTSRGELGQDIYFMGIIDILQQYNLKKRSETFLRSAVSDPKLISAVDPNLYGDRFLEFMDANSI